MNELISVIMPVYNGAAYLPHALKSVDAQDHDNLEIVVIDDGSTDETAEIARSHSRVRYQYQGNRGISEAMNSGLRLARGKYITFLDADDWWSDDKLILQLGFLKGSSAQIVAGYVQPVKFADASGNRNFKPIQEPYSLLNLGSALFLASVFEKIGPFDPDFNLCGDWDWFLRAREAAVEMLIHPDVVLYYLRHTNNVTNERAAIRHGLLKLFKKTLDRQRKAGLTSPLPNFSDLMRESGLPLPDVER
jgi:glycosyltransferase involved in cell wall biosynthesis